MRQLCVSDRNLQCCGQKKRGYWNFLDRKVFSAKWCHSCAVLTLAHVKEINTYCYLLLLLFLSLFFRFWSCCCCCCCFHFCFGLIVLLLPFVCFWCCFGKGIKMVKINKIGTVLARRQLCVNHTEALFCPVG